MLAVRIGFRKRRNCGSKKMGRAASIILITAWTFSLGGCGQSGPDAASASKSTPLTAATLGAQTILSSKDYLAQDKYNATNTDRGERLSFQCRACHTLEQGGAVILGPNLYGLFGRTAGSAPDYFYSDVLAASGFVWTPRALDAWLAQPFAFMPGNRMSFPGLPNGDDRNALIAYLLQQTDAATDDEK